MKINDFGVQYRIRTAKGQILTNFALEFRGYGSSELATSVKLESKKNSREQRLFVDLSANFRGSGVGIIIHSPDGEVMEFSLRFKFPTTNNEVEYEALIIGIKMEK